MTSINDLAIDVANAHGISHTAAVDAITVHVDTINDDPDLWNPDTNQLTDAGVEVVTAAIAETYNTGAIATYATQLLEQIADAEARRADHARRADEARAARDELIRAAMRTEARRADIMAAGNVGEQRLYQIRDGRRR